MDRSVTRKIRRRDLLIMEMAKSEWWRPGCRYVGDDGLISGYGRSNSLTRVYQADSNHSISCRQLKRSAYRLRHNYNWLGGAPFLAYDRVIAHAGFASTHS